MSEGFVITAKGMSPDQLAAIEERAGQRLLRMLPVVGRVGNLTLAVAALVMEIIEEAQPENTTMVYIIAQDDLRSIIRSYLKRHKLTTFPYKNGALLDYVSYADFTRVAACIG